MEIVQRRSESDSTVIISSLTKFDVLINPPNLISVLLRSHLSPEVVVLADGVPMGISPQ
jgi:hypothetical protein